MRTSALRMLTGRRLNMLAIYAWWPDLSMHCVRAQGWMGVREGEGGVQGAGVQGAGV